MRCDYGLVGIGQAAAHYGVSVVTMRLAIAVLLTR